MPALAGVDVLFLVNSGPELAALDELAAKAAKATRVKRLVKLSSYDAREQNVGTGIWHAAGEAAIRTSCIPFVFVQPSGFPILCYVASKRRELEAVEDPQRYPERSGRAWEERREGTRANKGRKTTIENHTLVPIPSLDQHSDDGY
jgi:hypothetical protein